MRTTRPGMWLRSTALVCASALLLAACTTSKTEPVSTDGLRKAVGTDLIGAQGKTAKDQAGIDGTAAGLCGANIWTKSECARHGRESRRATGGST